MVVYDIYGARLSLGEEVARGSAATLYEIPALTGVLAKVYHSYHEEYEAKLRWMMAHPPAAIDGKAIAWPSFLLFNAKASFIGYAMPYLRNAIPLGAMLARPTYLSPAPSLRDLHRLGHQLASAVERLHAAGYVTGSLHPNNVLVTLPDRITLIDTDSFQVKTQYIAETVWYHSPTRRPAYQAPELQGKDADNMPQAPEQDRFSLAVLIFQLLMGGYHPFEGRWRGTRPMPPLEQRIAEGHYPYATASSSSLLPPHQAPSLDSLHPKLAILFERCFVDGHRATWKRPWPLEWQEALEEAEQSLTTCFRGHHFPKHLQRCPECAQMANPTRARARRGSPSRVAAAARAVPGYVAQTTSSGALYNTLFPGMSGVVLRWWPPSRQTLQLLWALMAPMILVLSPCIVVTFLQILCSGLF
jgi:DNA-binding helix-hairpin-helix protein with protein kinase domain